jgi:predicted ATP-grasp superfamily ATP-dependent carboligase
MEHETLVILGSTITALAVARHAWSLGLSAVIVDHKPGIACSSRLATHRVHDDADEALNLQRLCSLGGSRSYLIATDDNWLRFLVKHRSALDAGFDRVLHPANATIEVCLDKNKFAEWCQSLQMSSPSLWSPEQLDDLSQLPLPVFIRPAQTRHHLAPGTVPKAVEATTEATLRDWLLRYRELGVTPLVTESLLNRRLTQFSVPFASCDGALVSFVARKARPPADWSRVGTYVELSPQPEVEALARRAVKALNYRGIGEVEILHSEDDGKPYLIEINARPWLQYSIAPASGHNLLGVALGWDHAKDQTPRKTGVQWLNFWSDAYVCFSRSEGLHRSGRLGIREYLTSVLHANAYAVFDWRDPLPAVQDFWEAVTRSTPIQALSRTWERQRKPSSSTLPPTRRNDREGA